MKLVLLPLAAYLLGSIPWGVVLTRGLAGVDIRRQGSGNIGATNVRRLAGNRLGALTLAGDVLKGLIPTALAMGWSGSGPAAESYVVLVALCAFAGHLYPVYFGMRGGGKGVATAAGAFLAVSPGAVGIALAVFLAMAGITRRVSVGSMAGAAALAPALGAISGSLPLALGAGVVAILIFLRHGDNLRRLAAGTEPRIGS